MHLWWQCFEGEELCIFQRCVYPVLANVLDCTCLEHGRAHQPTLMQTFEQALQCNNVAIEERKLSEP